MAAFSVGSENNQTVSSIKALFEFLTDFKNFAALLPQDKVEDYKYDENECSFTIKGMGVLSIRLAEKIPFESLQYIGEGFGKYSFNLKVLFTGDPSQAGICKVELGGDLNPFIAKMAMKPLGQLVNTMAIRLAELKF
jgi:hypothetical protein